VSILDLIDTAIADATSDDAVRYNAPAHEARMGVRTWVVLIDEDQLTRESALHGNVYIRSVGCHLQILTQHVPGIRIAMEQLGRDLTKFFATYQRRERMRRIHTAHPAHWRRP
jgi:hypothetical protein